MSEPAFPVSTEHASYGHQDGNGRWQYPGLSVRDYFAAKALSGFLAHPNQDEAPLRERSPAMLAAESYRLADAMLEARAKGGVA